MTAAKGLGQPDYRFERPTISSLNISELAFAPAVGDINDLDRGPARFIAPEDDTAKRNLLLRFDAPVYADAALLQVRSVSWTANVGGVTLTADGDSNAQFPNTSLLGATAQLALGERVFVVAFWEPGTATSVDFRLAFNGWQDTDNVIDVERIEFFKTWEVPEAFDTDWRVRYVDPSLVERSDGQVPYGVIRDRLRELRVSLRKRQESDLITPPSSTGLTWPRFLKRAGISRPVMIIPRDTGEWVDVEAAVFGLITNQPEIGHHAGQVFDGDEIVVLELP